MKTRVGIRKLKNELSRYIDRVREGTEVVITDRGKPVAVISPLPLERLALSVETHLATLAADGHLALGSGVRPRRPRGKSLDLSKAVLADRKGRG